MFFATNPQPQPSLQSIVVVFAFWRRRKGDDASLDAIKGMRCRKTGEHFGGVVRSSRGFLWLGRFADKIQLQESRCCVADKAHDYAWCMDESPYRRNSFFPKGQSCFSRILSHNNLSLRTFRLFFLLNYPQDID